ncbi:hypothetical protein BZZ01_23605 [Nostocales cyanobacterium HT-58-2]|nr:hypothetical protein BZZ01_23605 [Nostocales cyanobacterium HT-58-2]
MDKIFFPRDPDEINKQFKGGIDLGRNLQFVNLLEKRQVKRIVRSNVIVIGPPSRSCEQVDQFFLYGSGMTGENGQAKISLSDYLCDTNLNMQGAERFSLRDLPWFLTTPVAIKPCYLTHSVELVAAPVPPGGAWIPDAPADIFIQVYSWLPNGDPAPYTQFSWHCSASYTILRNP